MKYGVGNKMPRAKAQRAPSTEKQENIFSLRSWHPFDLAQGMLGAINFLAVVLLNYLKSNRLMHGFTISATLCIFVSLAGGCGSTPASRFYTLSAAAVPAATSSNLSVAVGPVSVPAVVDRPEIVVSTGPNQVRLEEFNRWAAPLQNGIARVVAENLVAMLGTPRVTLSSQSSADADYRAIIEVQGFDSAPGEAATLDAVWTVRRTRDGKSETGRTTVRETVQGNGYDALAAAHSRALARLSREIADAVRALEK